MVDLKEQVEASPVKIIWTKFRSQRSVRWSLRILYFFLFLALFGDFIANEKPIFCQINGETSFPIFRSYGVKLGLSDWKEPFLRVDDWRTLEYEKVVFAPIPYSSTTIDFRNSFSSPVGDQRLPAPRFRHVLGTDELGRDVAAGMVAGARIAILVGLLSMGIATLIGIFLGSLAGFFGDRELKLPWIRIVLVLLFGFLGLFWAFSSRSGKIQQASLEGHLLSTLLLSLGIWAIVITIGYGLSRLLELVPAFRRRIVFPIDLLVVRLIEIIQSIPALLLLLSVAAIIRRPNIFYIMVLIGLIRWTSIAQFVRAELLRIREREYIDAARVMGFPRRRILIRHALPNALGPVLITIAFGIAAAILIEASLSFLGIGLSAQDVTWGSMLNMARRNFTAWWLAVLPGVAIFLMVTIFNLLGQGLTDSLDLK
ncbi:MAG: ABC transporter permease [Saprospiraceae bacterium]|nr:ABC transporter permease [Saprospiraceae bacterium]